MSTLELPAGFAIYYWNRPAPAIVAKYWLIFCGIAMTGAISMWWVPYFFGTSAKTRKLYADMYAGTWQSLPPRGDNPRPNVFHILAHALLAATLVIAIILRFGKA